MFKVDGVACVIEDDGDDISEFWVEFQGPIDAVYRQLRDRLSNIGESTSSFNLVARLAEFVCLLDLLVSVEEYKLDGKKPWITFQDDFISQAEAQQE